MNEELQNLLDRIQSDGVEKAEKQARDIVADAEKKAQSIVAEAEKTAAETREKAERDRKLDEERGKKALEQAARDVVLSVGEAVTKALERIVAERTGEALSKDVLKEMLVKAVASYVGDKGGDPGVDVLVSAGDEVEIKKLLMAELGQAVGDGLEVRGDGEVVRGFKVSLSGGTVEHDFTQEAIAEALCQLVRPRLAEIVRESTPGE